MRGLVLGKCSGSATYSLKQYSGYSEAEDKSNRYSAEGITSSPECYGELLLPTVNNRSTRIGVLPGP